MRESGVLMHISSLPSPYGIGSLGRAAYDFVDFLKRAGVSIWSMLPAGPTGFGDSPYQSFCVFALNPYFLDLDALAEEGLIDKAALSSIDWGGAENRVDYAKLYHNRFGVLRSAYNAAKSDPALMMSLKAFEAERPWVRDYALFMALRSFFGEKPLESWPDAAARRRDADALKRYEELLCDDIGFHEFVQFKLFKQWFELKRYANAAGIRLMGDLPIYVSPDSSDVWASPEQFMLDGQLRPTFVAGVPPDYFSSDGQLWGNPLYDWERMKRSGYEWWINRFRSGAELYDILRIDHFRGFEAFYAIAAGETTARRGVWLKGPNTALFNRVKKRLGELEIVAENLGHITTKVKRMLSVCGFAGMKVLMFAFNGDGKNPHLPLTGSPNCAIYTGTHDNATVIQWWDEADENEKAAARGYLKLREGESICEGMIRAALDSPCRYAIIPIQDWLEIGGEGRMNRPGVCGGNWSWRAEAGALTDALAAHIFDINNISGRTGRKE